MQANATTLSANVQSPWPHAGSKERIDLIEGRLAALRSYLVYHKLDAFIVPSSDPHQSEYLADYWKFSEYLTGFTGSFGSLVVSTTKAGFWTDSRYFLQAETELKGTGITLYKIGLPGTPTPEEWIADTGCNRIGLDGYLFSTNEVLRLKKSFAEKNRSLITNHKPYNDVWSQRPLFPNSPINLFPDTYAGESVDSKLNRVRKCLLESGVDALPVTALDDIAWLLNIRGRDVDYNPVVMAFVYLDATRCLLFVEASKVTQEIVAYLSTHNVELAPYETFSDFIGEQKGLRLYFDKGKTNFETYSLVEDACTLLDGMSPIARLKAVKNPVESDGFNTSMHKDGVALVRLFKWLESVTDPGKKTTDCYPTEWAIGQKAAAFRSEQDGYVCESFAPIVAFKDHGAVVHYEAEPETAYTVEGEGALLMDLGAHYLTGTTDTTRTFYLNGTPPSTFKDDYTRLLKGLIALSNATFPAGTRGCQLDVLARQFIWEKKLNYLHGTGHGIGHCLYVHEGPQSIRMNENPTTLEPGMVVSNEPGLYRAGEYGIRLENVLQVVELDPSSFGRFFAFDTLTLAPFDLNGIKPDLLTPVERQWLDDYHQRVYEQLADRLNEEERYWLREKTHPLSRYTFNN